MRHLKETLNGDINMRYKTETFKWYTKMRLNWCFNIRALNGDLEMIPENETLEEDIKRRHEKGYLKHETLKWDI